VELAFATLIRRVVAMRAAEQKSETSERKKKMRNACSIPAGRAISIRP